ncbi:MAG TPA: biopolymer transporter ExbD [Chitinophagales bacterium]|nr:biopolymer transporter ExbD [Chitinophagales bacterium]
MPKVKVPRKSTAIDMTAMCDVAFLLLTFFMLTTKFKPDEPVIVDTPSSVSEIKLPETDIITIMINKDNRVFFGIDGQPTRVKMLEKMAAKHGLTFTEDEKAKFSLIQSFGVPVSNLKQFINMKPDERTRLQQPGIPIDTLREELGSWVLYARQSNPAFRIAIKGDRDASYPTVKRVFDILQERQINKFNFITSLEAAPDESALKPK